MREAEREAERAERLRLYYVAMTRAIDRLIVSGAIDPEPNGRPGHADRLGARRASRPRSSTPPATARSSSSVTGRDCSSGSTATGQSRPRLDAGGRAGDRRGRPARALRRRRARRRCRRRRRACPSSRRCPRRRSTAFAGSPTARSRSSSGARTATTPSGSPACGPRTRTAPCPGADRARRDGDRRRGAPAARDGRPGGARRPRGRRPCATWYPAVTDEELERIRDFVASYCESELAHRIAALPGAAPERPFAFEHDGVLLHGRLDVYWSEGSRALVLDYKTNSLAEGTPEEIVAGRLPAAAARLRARVLPGRGGARSRSSTTSSSVRTPSSRPRFTAGGRSRRSRQSSRRPSRGSTRASSGRRRASSTAPAARPSTGSAPARAS